MTNHYLKALEILQELIPDIRHDITARKFQADTGRRSDMGNPAKARDFAVEVLTDYIEHLQEIRTEVQSMSLKRF